MSGIGSGTMHIMICFLLSWWRWEKFYWTPWPCAKSLTILWYGVNCVEEYSVIYSTFTRVVYSTAIVFTWHVNLWAALISMNTVKFFPGIGNLIYNWCKRWREMWKNKWKIVILFFGIFSMYFFLNKIIGT